MHQHSLGITGCAFLKAIDRDGSQLLIYTWPHLWLAPPSRKPWDTDCTFSLVQQSMAAGPKQVGGNTQRHKATAHL